jgi:hypothetical protein
MFKAAVLREDNSILLIRVEIQRNRGKRSADGCWRGAFSVPTNRLRPLPGTSVQLKFDDGSSVWAVVAGIGEEKVHFRAEGAPPRPSTRRRRRQTALAAGS